MEYSDYVIFVDESGDHSLEMTDDKYPIFVLDFCIFRKDHYANAVVPSVEAFKFRYFGHDIVILHEREIYKQMAPFEFLSNQSRRRAFMRDLNDLVDNSNFTIVATVIDKQRHAKSYNNPANPYQLAFLFCMERSYRFLQDLRQHDRITHIVVERRGKREDNELELAFRRIRDNLSQAGTAAGFELIFADKKVNSSGLQLADLTARPIGRHVMKPAQPNRAWDIIERKLRRGPAGEIQGWGLKAFP